MLGIAKWLFAFVFLVALAFGSPGFAGEKEEAQLKEAMLRERITRLYLEYQIAVSQLNGLLQAKMSDASSTDPVRDTVIPAPDTQGY